MTKLDGTWKLSARVGPNRGTAAFELVVARGGSLSGTYRGLVGSAALTGTVDRDAVAFTFKPEKGGAVTYQGTRIGDRLEGTCTYEAAGTGTFEGHRVDS